MKTWEEFERGRRYLDEIDFFGQLEESFRFYEGDQWHGLQTGGERLPVLNVIAPIVKYKVAMVAQNGMSINYSAPYKERLCAELNSRAAQTWERLDVDRLLWEIAEEGCVAGSAYLYFYDDRGRILCDRVDPSSIIFADEGERDIQKQEYILIAQRLPAQKVIEQARKNGISEAEISLIRPDSETLGEPRETEDEDESLCLSVLKLFKKDGEVWVSRCVKDVEYQPETRITGMTLYPIAAFNWQNKRSSARGRGEVYPLIPNQIEINKMRARIGVILKNFAYPKLAYLAGSVDSPRDLEKVGSAIEVHGGSAAQVDSVIRYLQPAAINPLALSDMNNFMAQTRELAGAGDAVLGNINPERASGAAILAVRDAAALPLNSAISNYRALAEQIARIWLDMTAAYNPGGIEYDGGVAVPEALRTLNIRVDVSSRSPYSKFAQEQTLQNMLAAGLISFEEYVSALDDDAAAPKGKLAAILENRALAAVSEPPLEPPLGQQIQ